MPSNGAWTDLGGGIRVRQSRLFQMNSLVLHEAEHAVLVDPGILPSEIDDIARVAAKAGAAETTLLFTHADWDHVLGRAWWPQASSLAHDRFAAELARKRDKILEEARAAAAGAGERWERGFDAFRPRIEVSGLHFLKLGAWRLVLRDAPGHSASMLSVHLPEHRLLVAADMLSDIEIPTLQQSCDTYRRTLLELLTLVEHGAIETVVPGHGSIARGRQEIQGRLTRDVHYLDALERGVRDAVQSGWTISEAQGRLGSLVDDDSMTEQHRDNVRITYEGLVAAASPAGRSGVK